MPFVFGIVGLHILKPVKFRQPPKSKLILTYTQEATNLSNKKKGPCIYFSLKMPITEDKRGLMRIFIG